MLTIILICAIAAVLLLRWEMERQSKAKHRASTQRLLDYIGGINLPRSFRLEANAAGTRWEN